MERQIHPGAWWLWGITTAWTCLATTNLVLLTLIATGVLTTYFLGRPAVGRHGGVGPFVRIAGFIVLGRLLLTVVFGTQSGGHELFSVPSISLPDWASGISIGGPVTLEALVAALSHSAQLAIMVIAFGVTNILCPPARLLRLIPAGLYELGVAAVVASTVTPNALAAAGRLRSARKLRGRPTSGVRGLRHVLVPVLETSLDQSIDLAASMDVRGFGRAAEVTPARRRRATLSLAIGAIGSAMTLYAVLSPGVDTLATVFAGVGAIGGLGWSIRELGVTNPRTTYRRIPFTPVSSVMATVAVGAVLAIELGRRLDPLALEPPIHPLALPKVPWWFFGVALLVAAPVALANDRPTRDEQIGDAPINDAEWAQHRLSEQSGAR